MDHLVADRIASAALSQDEVDHLAGCLRCRAERRLRLQTSGLAGAASQDGGTLSYPNPTVGPAAPEPTSSARYEDLGLIGRGGMGEVRRVRDVELNRVVALKRVRSDVPVTPALLARFVEEVQTTAQLQHPNIVPVYDTGWTADGWMYFTMKEVHGRTLREVIREVDAASVERWETTPSGWSLRRLVAALHQASQAVAYAHERGVVHRDLKPENVMVGRFGEVLVMDWGLSRVGELEVASTEPIVVPRSRSSTRVGSVTGTPAYMAPEQARGDIRAIDARTDVYALGAVLYEILTGRAPYHGPSGAEVVERVVAGPPEPPIRRSRPDQTTALDASEAPSPLATASDVQPPDELVRICLTAMARSPDDRYATAAALADELQAWLDGSKRRERALEVLAQADAIVPDADALRARAAALRAEADAELAAIPGWEPEQGKLAGWAKQAEAAALESQASLKSLERDQLLAASLTYVPELPEAHAALVEDQRGRHAAAEAARDIAATTRAEALLRAHLDALPKAHPVRQRCAAYLRGTGAVTLVTDPDGADVELLRYEPYGRRLVAKPVRDLGRTPLVEVPLEMGSYLLVLRHPGRAEVRYPVHIGRGAHWDGVRPGSREPFPIRLPAAGELGPDDCYVPAGWFQAGGRTEYGSLPLGTRLWCDAFVLRRGPVTNAEYVAFLDDLVARGREEDALRWAPRLGAGQRSEPGAIVYGRDEAGRFVLGADAEGDEWLPDWPVVLVDWRCATAFGAWFAERTGAPWRLPWDLEWEKAARGVDGRFMPWGDEFDPSFCNLRDSHPGRPLPSAVDAFPLDESPYGVRGLGGNVRDWCVDVWTKAGPPSRGVVVAPFEDEGELSGSARRVYRGGFWSGDPSVAQAAYRYGVVRQLRVLHVGFRLARPAPGPSVTLGG